MSRSPSIPSPPSRRRVSTSSSRRTTPLLRARCWRARPPMPGPSRAAWSGSTDGSPRARATSPCASRAGTSSPRWTRPRPISCPGSSDPDRPPLPTHPRHGRTLMSSLKIAVLGALAACLVAAAPPALAQTTTLTMSSWVSPQHHLTSVVLQGWANEVEKATNGRVKFQMLPKHPSAPPGTFDAVRDGLVDVSYVTASYTPARHILPLMAELPGAGETALINSVAYSRIYWKHFDKVGEYKGVKLLGVFTHGPGQMFTKRPIAGIGDLQGLKIRTGGGVAEAVAKTLGASAFVKPAPESYELLKGGVADGVFFPLESIISFKLETVVEQATLFPGGMYSSAFGFFMNEDKWNKLPKADQEAIAKLSGEHLARLAGQSWDDADKKGLEALQKSGVKIVNADPAFVAEVQKRSAPIVDDWIKKASAKGIDGAKVLAEFRAELKKVAAGQ